MIPAAVVWALVAILGAVAHGTYDVSYRDPADFVTCDVYRAGALEVNVCRYDTGTDEGGML